MKYRQGERFFFSVWFELSWKVNEAEKYSMTAPDGKSVEEILQTKNSVN